jgi:hypothetical protein
MSQVTSTSSLSSVPSAFVSAPPSVATGNPVSEHSVAMQVDPALEAAGHGLEELNLVDVVPEAPVPFIGGGPGHGQYERPVKMPDWKEPKFSPGQSWTAHKQLFYAKLECVSGLTPQQKSHFFLDSLTNDVRILAESRHVAQGLPPLNQMLILLDDAYPASRTTLNDEFEDQLGRIKQEVGEKLSAYLARVQLVLNKYRSTVANFDPRRFYKLRELAYQALALRLIGSDNDALDAQKRLWLEKGLENPLLRQDRYDTVCLWLMQRTSEIGSETRANKPPKVLTKCRYDADCTKQGCKFLHSASKKGVGKKVGSATKVSCNYCKKTGHLEAACYKKKG